MRSPGSRWLVLGTAFVVVFFGGGSRHVFGLLLVPMSEDLEWSRTSLSIAPTIFFWVSAAAIPFSGRLADRQNLRWVIGIAGCVAALGLGLMVRIDALWQVFLLYGVIYALGSAAFGGVGPVGVLVTRSFPERRGIANSLALSGNAVGQLVIITALSAALATIGWRWSFGVVAIAILAVPVPLVLMSLRSVARPSDGNGGAPGTPDAAPASNTVREAVGSSQFWLLITIYACCGFQDFLVATHIVAFAKDQGVGTVLSGNLLAFMGVLGVFGVMLSGGMADKWGAVWPTALCFVVRIALFALIITAQNTASIVFFALPYGFTFLITAPLIVVFVGNIFGSARLGTIGGLIAMSHQIAGGAGALAGAVIFDQFDSYQWAFVVMLAMSILATVLTFAVRERPLSAARLAAPA